MPINPFSDPEATRAIPRTGPRDGAHAVAPSSAPVVARTYPDRPRAGRVPRPVAAIPAQRQAPPPLPAVRAAAPAVTTLGRHRPRLGEPSLLATIGLVASDYLIRTVSVLGVLAVAGMISMGVSDPAAVSPPRVTPTQQAPAQPGP